MTASPSLSRQIFKTSRLPEFCSQKELVNQTGHAVKEWPLVILKELIDNAIDAAEEAGIAPVVNIDVTETGIVITDNGPGMTPKTISDILDYTVRVSSREAYVSPSRGAQGNALKTIVAMGFALDGKHGETVIESRGVSHRIGSRSIISGKSPGSIMSKMRDLYKPAPGSRSCARIYRGQSSMPRGLVFYKSPKITPG